MLALMWLWWDVKSCHKRGMVSGEAAWQCGLQCFIQGRFSAFIYVCQIFRALALFQGACVETRNGPFQSPCSGLAD